MDLDKWMHNVGIEQQSWRFNDFNFKDFVFELVVDLMLRKWRRMFFLLFLKDRNKAGVTVGEFKAIVEPLIGTLLKLKAS